MSIVELQIIPTAAEKKVFLFQLLRCKLIGKLVNWNKPESIPIPTIELQSKGIGTSKLKKN